jgi:glycosyltransferase involved in cell wall biosynthesis
MMRILYVSSVYKPAYVYGGPARSVPLLCEALAKAGAGVEVLTTDANRRRRLDVPLATPIDVDGVLVTYFPVVNERYFYTPALLDALRRRIHQFDVVELDTLFSALHEPAAAICRKAGVPYVAPPRGQLMPAALREKRWKKRIYLKLAGLRTLNAAAGIHCADPMEAEALPRAGVTAPAFVVPNGLDLPAESPAPSGRSIREQLAIPDSVPLMLSAGRFHRVKRLDVAVAALASVPRAHLLLVGPDEENLAPALRAQAASLGCADRLHILPLQSAGALRRIQAATDLFLMPSGSESFGMAAAEAMAAGLPVLVSDHEPAGRWAQAAEAGWVAPNDPRLFAEAARAMLALPAGELRAMGARARRCAGARFERSAVARLYLDRVAALCGRGASI